MAKALSQIVEEIRELTHETNYVNGLHEIQQFLLQEIQLISNKLYTYHKIRINEVKNGKK